MRLSSPCPRRAASAIVVLAFVGCSDAEDSTPLAPAVTARAAVVATASYEIVDLGSLGGRYGYATAINSNGQITGDSDDEFGRRRAFRWDAGTMTQLGTLGGSFSQAYSINTGGAIAGYSWLSGDVVLHAVLWNGSTPTDLGTLPRDGNSMAFAVGEGGHVVGNSWGSDLFDHAFVWHNGVMTHLLPVVRGTTRAHALNTGGDVIGSSDFGFGSGVAVVWLAGSAVPTNLGTLGGYSSGAADINDAGQIVGTAELFPGSYDRHAFRWENGVMTDLGSLGGAVSEAIAINRVGDVVGWSLSADGTESRAFLWRGGSMIDPVTLPDWRYCAAVDINDAGQVFGSCNVNGKAHTFLWENGAITDLPSLGGHASPAIRYGLNNSGQAVGYSDDADGVTHPVLWRIAVLTVTVDIKPGSATNPINLKAKGVIPVAILSDATLDATTLDVRSIRFGPGGAVEVHGKGHVEDVNGDGRNDLVLHFDVQASGIACGATSASVSGQTSSGRQFSGSDAVSTTGCR